MMLQFFFQRMDFPTSRFFNNGTKRFAYEIFILITGILWLSERKLKITLSIDSNLESHVSI